MVCWEFEGGVNHTTILEKALAANPTPLNSHYQVRAAGMTKSGRFFHLAGSNHEYGNNSSAHAEYNLVSTASDLAPNDPLVTIAIIAGEPDNLAAPCGDCRDYLREYIDPQAVIICGSLKGGRAIVRSFSAYLQDDFPVSNVTVASGDLGLALLARKKSYDLYAPGKYVAVIRTKGGSFASGEMQTVNYKPTSPVASAITLLRNGGGPDRLQLEELQVYGFGEGPKVLYTDRQIFHELLKGAELFGVPLPVPIKLVELSLEDKVSKVCVTDSHHWFPHPFFPDFGGDKFREAWERIRSA